MIAYDIDSQLRQLSGEVVNRLAILTGVVGADVDSPEPDRLTVSQRKIQTIMLDEAVQGFTRRRFLDLGLTPGTKIYPELGNFFGEPRAYRVRGTLIALRKDQASQIWVKLAQES